MRQHGIASDIADGKDVRHVGAHLRIDGHETSGIAGNANGFEPEIRTVRQPAGRLQDQIIGPTRVLRADDLNRYAVGARFGTGDAGVEIDSTEAMIVAASPDLYRIGVKSS